VGDAVIAFFPCSYNKLLACDNSVYCALSMMRIVLNRINPILNQYDYPELSIKIGVGEGENIIVQYDHDESSAIDILGYCMSITAKITSITDPNRITIGEDVYNSLHPVLKTRFISSPASLRYQHPRTFLQILVAFMQQYHGLPILLHQTRNQH
jgi:class 3 adenylate cyclase